MLVQLVPDFAPNICGIGDYAHVLDASIQQLYQRPSRIVVANPGWQGQHTTAIVIDRSAESFAAVIANVAVDQPRVDVLVHYEPYGYAVNAQPHWLVGCLAVARQASAQSVGVFVHEPGHRGAPWRRSFWRYGGQQRILRDIGLNADWVVTSCEALVAHLDRNKVSVDAVLPVVSNVGEPSGNSSFAQRANQMVVFGSRNRKDRLYGDYAEQLLDWAIALKVERIVDVGPPCQSGRLQNGPVNFAALGVLPASEVSQLLLDSCYGVLHTEPPWLAKSGVFAAYASHGVVPVVLTQQRSESDGLMPERHYLSGAPDVSGDHATRSQAVYDWYQQHRGIKHAEVIMAHCS